MPTNLTEHGGVAERGGTWLSHMVTSGGGGACLSATTATTLSATTPGRNGFDRGGAIQ